MKEIKEGIFKEGRNLFTINLIPGKKVYGETLIKNEKEYREWNHERSKLAAAIMKGLDKMPIKKGDKILYLGASTGTTPSHISDVVGKNGLIYGIEFSERVFRSLIELSKQRKNISPILADARKIKDYSWIEEVDIVYVDIADPQETEITIKNADVFLKNGGYIFVAVKSQSIDVTKDPAQVYKEETKKLHDAGYSIEEVIELDPYEAKHAMILARK